MRADLSAGTPAFHARASPRQEPGVRQQGAHEPAARERSLPPAWRRRAGTALTWALLLLVAALLVQQARHVQWSEVGAALRHYGPATLLLAAALAGLSHLLYSTFDLIGRRHTRHPLGTLQVMRVAFISYIFNLNFGSLVGAVAMRFSLYARAGLRPGVVAQIFGLSVAANWLGYALLAGTLFVLHPPALPTQWAVGATTLRSLGALMLLPAVVYVAACAWAPQRRWHWRSHAIALPSLRTALWQAGVGFTNWLLMGATVYALMRPMGAGYAEVLAVTLIAAVAGVISHIPAGLGVLEAVFLALLAPRHGTSDVLAGLLAYRALYYLVPLLPALTLWLFANRGTGMPIAEREAPQPPQGRPR